MTSDKSQRQTDHSQLKSAGSVIIVAGLLSIAVLGLAAWGGMPTFGEGGSQCKGDCDFDEQSEDLVVDGVTGVVVVATGTTVLAMIVSLTRSRGDPDAE